MVQPIKLWKIMLPVLVIVLLAIGGLVMLKRGGNGSEGATAGVNAIPGGLRVGAKIPE